VEEAFDLISDFLKPQLTFFRFYRRTYAELTLLRRTSASRFPVSTLQIKNSNRYFPLPLLLLHLTSFNKVDFSQRDSKFPYKTHRINNLRLFQDVDFKPVASVSPFAPSCTTERKWSRLAKRLPFPNKKIMVLRRSNPNSTAKAYSAEKPGFLGFKRLPAAPGIPNLSQALPNRLIIMIVLACRCCSSDFNVVIPEICNLTETSVNISWIQEMVHLGIRDDLPLLSLNIAKPKGNTEV